MRPLPEPKAPTDKHPGDLRAFLNVTDDDHLLILGFLLQALRPGAIAREYPVLVLTGEQGSAKTTTARLLAECVDPNSPPLQGKPKSIDDLFVAANSSHLLAFDNLSNLTDELSDALCGLSTGTGYRKRKLYTNQEETVIQGAWPIIINGIGDIVGRPDLLDRSIILELPPIPDEKRRGSGELQNAFHEEHPYVLGRLIELFQTGLRNISTVQLDQPPRMAEFARWGTACLGPAFLEAYERNRRELVTEAALDATPIYEELAGSIKHPSHFEGTAAELLDLLETGMDDGGRKPAFWPKNARAFSQELRRIAPDLRAAGHTIEFRRSMNKRTIYFAPNA